MNIKPISRWLRSLGRFLMHTRTGRVLVFLSLPLILVTIFLWEPSYQPPIFDSQVHYNETAWERVSVKAVLNTAEKINIPWLLVGSTPNEGTWLLYRNDPERVIPMLVPQLTQDDRETWFNDPKILRYIENELKHKPYRGIGEFFLFNGQVDTPVVRGMVKLARKHHLVLHARSDHHALRQLFALDPTLRILWAHAGMFTPPETVGRMLDRYQGLWVEISHRGDVAPRGKLDPKWRELMFRHSDRFLLGSGTYNNEYWYQFRYIHGRYRGWLKGLPPDIAERIAFRNGLVLFDLKFQKPTNRF